MQNETSGAQQFYTAEETGMMFVAACDKIADECASREDLTPEERVKLAVRGVFLLIDNGYAELGVPMMALKPQIQETVQALSDGPVDFRIPNKEDDIAGSLHEYAHDPEAVADGHALLAEFSTSLGKHLSKFGFSFQD